MLSPALFSVLLAQAPEAKEAAAKATEAVAEGSALKALVTIATVLAVLILPFIIGNFLAKNLRTPEFGARIGAVLFAIVASALVVGFGWPPKLGVDLKGGVILTYRVADKDADRSALIEALGRRINPSGTKEIVIRPYGPQQVEIIIPEVDPIEVKRIKTQIEQTGVLEFRIVANANDHDHIIQAAKDQAKELNPSIRLAREVKDVNGDEMGLWVNVGRQRVKVNGVIPFKIQGLGSFTLRDGATGKLLDDPAMPRTTENQAMEKWLDEQGIGNVQILMALDDYNITGDYLAMASASFDDRAKPCVNFKMSPKGGTLFGAFTHANRPTDTYARQLGIVLDNTLQSAPNLNEPISTSGQITGSFTTEEVDTLVNILRAGKLPSSLEGPTSDNEIGSLLGVETINKGTKAIGISLAVVLIFIAIYYRFAGLVACAALLLNLLLILGILILFQQPLTLPGLAGLVLTVGMSVDANVLIFERIREELGKGAALRMGIRNGFGRATTTIVDANVTTLITAIVLYAIGTDQIKGFAVTLIIGIIMSMFTAIFCSRVVFELAERKRWLTQLSMMEVLGGTNIDFIGKRKIAGVVSVVLIMVGIGAVAARGTQIFDIDFRGGTAVTMMLEQPMKDSEVREKLTTLFEKESEKLESSIQFNLNKVSVEGEDENLFWKVTTSFEDVDQLKALLKQTFPLANHSMSYGNVEETLVGGNGTTEPSTTEPSTTEPSTTEPSTTEPSTTEPSTTEPSTTEPSTTEPPVEEPAKESGSNDGPSDEDGAGLNSAAGEGELLAFSTEATMAMNALVGQTAEAPAGSAAPAPGMEFHQTAAELEFGSKINYATLKDRIETTAAALKVNTMVDVVLNEPSGDKEWTPESPVPFNKWKATLNVDEVTAQKVFSTMQEDMNSEPIWHAADKIGSQVAGKTQSLAVWALLSSLLGIVAYIWIRFQKVVFGLAAVVALVHDVLITLGAIAISFWLAGALSFLQIEEFKISLPVVAAFLTIIGYSLNDTIVVFDRIREVRGKSPELTEAMINASINQTLGRTLLTSITTLLVVTILYAGGGQSIHGFSFALLVGVIVGTYSSIFVASPALLWLMDRFGADH